jgi:hypothetical protein
VGTEFFEGEFLGDVFFEGCVPLETVAVFVRGASLAVGEDLGVMFDLEVGDVGPLVETWEGFSSVGTGMLD